MTPSCEQRVTIGRNHSKPTAGGRFSLRLLHQFIALQMTEVAESSRIITENRVATGHTLL
jgi:hypothetical protein